MKGAAHLNLLAVYHKPPTGFTPYRAFIIIPTLRYITVRCTFAKQVLQFMLVTTQGAAPRNLGSIEVKMFLSGAAHRNLLSIFNGCTFAKPQKRILGGSNTQGAAPRNLGRTATKMILSGAAHRNLLSIFNGCTFA